MNSVLIRIEGVHLSYGQRPVLKGVDFALRAGERVGLVGPIGSGKTTLLHLVVGLLKPHSGTICILDRPRREEADFHEVRTKVGLVFQDPDDQLFCPTVLEDVAFGPLNLGKTSKEAKQSAQQALECVGLQNFGERITYRLSGGEKRLVALATVLAMEPEVLLLDEPTASLDAESVERVVNTLGKLSQSMLVVSHNMDFLSQVTERCVLLKSGRITQ